MSEVKVYYAKDVFDKESYDTYYNSNSFYKFMQFVEKSDYDSAQKKIEAQGQIIERLPDLLCNLAQLLSGFMYDESWSEFDQKTYDELLVVQSAILNTQEEL